MKKSHFITLIVVLMISGLFGCSKTEIKQDQILQEAIISEPSTYTIPLGTGDPDGTHTINLNLPPLNFPPSPAWPYNQRPYEHRPIEFATPEYLKETCLLDISKLEAGRYYHQVGTKDFSVAFFNVNKAAISMQKLQAKTPAPKGWSSEWNIFPFVEKDCSGVLFSSIEDGIFTIVLSKPCTEFGFEMTPNTLGKNISYAVEYGNFENDGTSGVIQPLTTYNPGGARIFALRAKEPFTVVEIYCQESPDNTGVDYTPGGSAITNIRYLKAK
jgi:hypothetical protein